MNSRNKNSAKLFWILASSLLSAHVIWTLYIFLSNAELAEKAKALTNENFFFISPCCQVINELEKISTAFYSAVFFTFTTGVFFASSGIIAAFCYMKFKGKLKSITSISYVLMLISAGYLLGEYFANIFVTAASFFITLRLKPFFNLAKIYILPFVLILLIPFLYNGNSFFSDFRDKVLLTNSFGKALNSFYYKYTLYPAEIIKSPLKKQLKTAKIEGFDSKEKTQIESILKKYNYFPLENKNIKKDVEIKKKQKNIIVKTNKKELNFNFKNFISDFDKTISKIFEKQNSFLKKTTITGFVVFLPAIIVFSLISLFNFFFTFFFKKYISKSLSSVLTAVLIYTIFLPVFNTSFNKNLTIEQNLKSADRFTRIDTLKYIYQNDIIMNISGKNLNSEYDAERYWAVLTFIIRTPEDIDKIIEKTNDKNINVRCKAYQRLGTIPARNYKLYKKASEFLKSDYQKIKDWYVQWYAFNYAKQILLR
ncbi:MAG: hypothetical protein AB7E04_07250 [Desulfobacteraceae bacterium]